MVIKHFYRCINFLLKYKILQTLLMNKLFGLEDEIINSA